MFAKTEGAHLPEHGAAPIEAAAGFPWPGPPTRKLDDAMRHVGLSGAASSKGAPDERGNSKGFGRLMNCAKGVLRNA